MELITVIFWVMTELRLLGKIVTNYGHKEVTEWVNQNFIN